MQILVINLQKQWICNSIKPKYTKISQRKCNIEIIKLAKTWDILQKERMIKDYATLQAQIFISQGELSYLQIKLSTQGDGEIWKMDKSYEELSL